MRRSAVRTLSGTDDAALVARPGHVDRDSAQPRLRRRPARRRPSGSPVRSLQARRARSCPPRQPLDEPHFNGDDSIVSTSGTTQFYEWNRSVDELTFIDKLQRLEDLREEFTRLRFAVETLSFTYTVKENHKRILVGVAGIIFW